MLGVVVGLYAMIFRRSFVKKALAGPLMPRSRTYTAWDIRIMEWLFLAIGGLLAGFSAYDLWMHR
jgi:hypothetical protein